MVDFQHANPTRRVSAAMITLLFVAWVGLPGFDLVFHVDPAPQLNERRALAERPKVPTTLREFYAWPGQFERYFNDHLGFRNSLIRANSFAMVYGFQKSPLLPPVVSHEAWMRETQTSGTQSLYPRVVVGRNGWLYFGEDETLDDYRGLRGWEDSDLRNWTRRLGNRLDWLKARGIAYAYAVAPNKHAVYPEFLPESLTPTSRQPKFTKWMEAMESQPGLPVLDLHSQILAEKAKGTPVYFPTDSHWTDQGGIIAYREIMDSLHRQNPKLKGLGQDEMTELRKRIPGGDLAEMIGLADMFPFDDLQYWPANYGKVRRGKGLVGKPSFVSEVDGQTTPTVVIFHDSFGVTLWKYFAATFGRCVCYPYEEFDPAIIEAEKPDAVIEIMAERHVVNMTARGLDALAKMPANTP
ncbi:MAG: hypothetical protein K1X53_02020 [Candidatus Sumerlaeaceae bacterium]|nr:hypothetical protein [Candidatus Sumerlaeaceae bacterium]